MKKLICVVALFLTSCVAPAYAATFGKWSSSPERAMIVYSENLPNGANLMVTAHLDGEFIMGIFPAGWVRVPGSKAAPAGDAVMKVNGQPVKFRLFKDEDGSWAWRAVTYRGREFIKGEFWTKSRVRIVNSEGAVTTLPANGVQQAWSHMIDQQGI